MGKTLSLDIRERVVLLVDEGLSCHAAARRLRVSAASAMRIMQRKRRTGGVKAAPQQHLRQAFAARCGSRQEVMALHRLRTRQPPRRGPANADRQGEAERHLPAGMTCR